MRGGVEGADVETGVGDRGRYGLRSGKAGTGRGTVSVTFPAEIFRTFEMRDAATHLEDARGVAGQDRERGLVVVSIIARCVIGAGPDARVRCEATDTARVLWVCACCQPRRGPFRFPGEATRLTPKGRVRVARREKSRSLLHVVC